MSSDMKIVAYVTEDCPAPVGEGVYRRGQTVETTEEHVQWMEERGYAERVAEDVTKEDLYEEAQELDITGRSSMTKMELAAAIYNQKS